jgi:hypothetical protein
MGWLTVPWAVTGGATIPVEAARAELYAAVGGREGIAVRGDCNVRETTVPDTNIRMTAGTVIITNRSLGGQGQSYAAVSPTGQQDIPVTATGGAGGRSDLVVARIRDPQYPPWDPPADPNDYEYVQAFIIEDVPSDTTTFAELGLDYSAVELARIDIPPSTATITNAMIHDLRKIAQPHVLLRHFAGTPEDPVVADDDPYVDVISFPLTIPDWATNMGVTCIVGGIKATGAVSNFGVRFQLEGTSVVTSDAAMTTTGDAYRTEVVTGGNFVVSDNGGETHDLTVQAHYLADGGPFSGVLTFDEYTKILIIVYFEEAPVT